MNNKNQIDMLNGNIFYKMLLFTIPLIASSVLQLLFNAADIVVVSNYAEESSLAAVGSTGSLINLLTNLFIGLSVGVNVLVARYIGSKSYDELKETVQTTLSISVIIGFLSGIFGVLVCPTILRIMHLEGQIWRLASLYLQIYFLGMPAVMIYNFGSAILRAVGDTRRPLIYMIFAGIINVILNLFFVIEFKLGVAGVGIATIVSQYISAALIVLCLIKEKSYIHYDIKVFRINRKVLFNILRIGLPAGLQGTLFSLSNVFIQSSVNTFGDIVIAGNSAAINLEGFVYVAMNAFYQATLSFVGQNVGAGKKYRIGQIVLIGLLLVTSTGLLLGNSVVLFKEPLLSIYKKNPDVIAAGSIRVQWICSIYFLCGIMDVMVGALRGLGYSTMPAIVSLLGACVFRLIWLATVFQIDAFHSVGTIYASYPISWILTFSVHLLCYIIIKHKYDKE